MMTMSKSSGRGLNAQGMQPLGLGGVNETISQRLDHLVAVFPIPYDP